MESGWTGQEFFVLPDIVRFRFPVRGHVDAQSADDGPVHAADAGDVGYRQILVAEGGRSYSIVAPPLIRCVLN